MEKIKGKISMALSSRGEIPRAKEGEAKGSLDCKGPDRTKDMQSKQVLFHRQLTTSPA